MSVDEMERLRRWRLVLGKEGGDGMQSEGIIGCGPLSKRDLGMDRVLEALYDSDRSAGLGSSAPNVSRWLGDIRTYFPSPTVRIMQQDALQKLNLTQMLLEPEMLEQ